MLRTDTVCLFSAATSDSGRYISLFGAVEVLVTFGHIVVHRRYQTGFHLYAFVLQILRISFEISHTYRRTPTSFRSPLTRFHIIGSSSIQNLRKILPQPVIRIHRSLSCRYRLCLIFCTYSSVCIRHKGTLCAFCISVLFLRFYIHVAVL